MLLVMRNFRVAWSAKRLSALGRFIIDSPPVELGDRPVAIDREPWQIPKQVFQTWETRRFGKTHWAELLRFRDINPEMSFYLFDKDMRDSYMQEKWSDSPIYEVYDRALFGPLKTDIFRYCIIYEKGGFYFDISKMLNLPISNFLSATSTNFLTIEGNLAPEELASRVPWMPRNLVAQWGFGFVPGHGLLEMMIELIIKKYPEYKNRVFDVPKTAILELSGPIGFYEAIGKYLSIQKNELSFIPKDFNGAGVYSIRGSGYRFIRYPSYADSRHSRLFR